MFNFFQENNKTAVKTVTPVLKLNSSLETVGEDITVATIKLRDFIDAVQATVLVDYENNRGNGRLNKSKAMSIAENYDPNKLGVITVAKWDDGTYKKADAHHRTAAIMLKFSAKDGLLPFTRDQLDQNISLHIIKKNDFIRVYSGLNSNNGHSQKAKVMNIDLGLGSMIKEILDLQEEDSVVKDQFYTSIARCVYAYVGRLGNQSIKNMTYADISLDRKSVSAEAGLSKEDFNVSLSNKEKEEVAAAIDYVNETYAYFQSLNNINLSKKGSKPKLNATGRSILRNASLFGFILWDRLSGRKIITNMKPKDLAYRITEKDAQVEKQSKFILNSELRDGAADKIVQYITTKKRV